MRTLGIEHIIGRVVQLWVVAATILGPLRKSGTRPGSPLAGLEAGIDGPPSKR